LHLFFDLFILEDCIPQPTQEPPLTYSDVQPTTIASVAHKAAADNISFSLANYINSFSLRDDFSWNLDCERKLVLLYAQMHRCSLQYDGQPIIYTFVDDRNDILNALEKFYSTQTHLIPDNVSLGLVLHKSSVKTCLMQTQIQGTGKANHAYPTVVNNLKVNFDSKSARLETAWGDMLVAEAQKMAPTTKVAKPEIRQRASVYPCITGGIAAVGIAGICTLSTVAASGVTVSGVIATKIGLTVLLAGLAANPLGATIIAGVAGAVVIGILGFTLYKFYQSHKHKMSTHTINDNSSASTIFKGQRRENRRENTSTRKTNSTASLVSF